MGKRYFKMLSLVIALSTILLTSCGSTSIPSEMVGHWDDGKTYTTFPLTEFTIDESGNMTMEMDYSYTGTLKSDGDQYEIHVENGTGTMSNDAVEDVKDGLKITAVYNEDGTITVSIKNKSGYYYMGPESEVFTKD